MTPTLLGRMQTRIFLILVVGVPVVLIVTPFLPLDWVGNFSRTEILGEAYRIAFFALFTVLFVGCVIWEPIYHGLQQFRWEKDWPTLFGLLTGINEGILTYIVLQAWGPSGLVVSMPAYSYAILFTIAWVAIFLAANGPLRVVFIRWRFRGGRII